MANLDHKLIRAILDNKANKQIKCTECSDLIAQYNIIVDQLDGLIRINFSKHELAQWINAINRYITLKDVYKIYDYPVRSIVYAELGTNIGNELSYEHIAVVLKAGNDKVFIIPCSSSDKAMERLRKNDSDFILGTIEGGFPRETAICLKDAGWISKAKIFSVHHSKVDSILFDRIYNKVFKDLFIAKSLEIEKQGKKVEEVLNIIATLNLEIENLKIKLEEAEKERDEYYDIANRATK